MRQTIRSGGLSTICRGILDRKRAILHDNQDTLPGFARFFCEVLVDAFSRQWRSLRPQNKQEHQDFLTGALTEDSFKVFKRKIVELFRYFDELSELDSKSNQESTEVFWFYSGIRPWAPIEVIQI